MIRSIRLFQFRNYTQTEVFFSPFNVFVGPNGHGKTNLLEAIGIAYGGFFLRTHQISALIQKDQNQTLVELVSEDTEKLIQHRFIIQQNRKKFYLNEKTISVHRLQQQFPVVTFTPQDVSLFQQEPENRRSTLDSAVKIWSSVDIVTYERWQKWLAWRNKLLKIFQENPQQFDPSLWEHVNRNYLEESAKITWYRIQWLKTFLPVWKTVLEQFWQLDARKLEIRYSMSDQNIWDWSHDQIKGYLFDRSWQLKAAEFQMGLTLIGPQRHDWECWWQGQNLRFTGSQGQHRALVLGFKMALLEWILQEKGQKPPLLLDDVLSELDQEHQQRFWLFLQHVNSQIFLTTSQIDWVLGQAQAFQNSIFLILNGKIQRYSKGESS